MNEISEEYLKRIVRLLKDIVEERNMTNEDKVKLIGLIF